MYVKIFCRISGEKPEMIFIMPPADAGGILKIKGGAAFAAQARKGSSYR